MPLRIEPVQIEVALRPGEVGVRQIDADGLARTAERRLDAEAAGVAEQVEHTPAGGSIAHQGPRAAMIEKQAGVEIGFEVDEKPGAALADHDGVAVVPGRLMLVFAPVQFAPELDGDRGRRSIESARRGGAQSFEPVSVDGRIGVAQILLQQRALAVDIDGERQLGYVAIVDTEAVDVLALCPARQVPIALADAVLEGGDQFVVIGQGGASGASARA